MKMFLGRISRPGVLMTVAFGAAFAVGCGGKQSMASKSATAYREAMEKGIPVSGGGHGGHSPGEGATAAGMDHSKMDKGGMAGMDHSKMEKGGMSGMDHSKMEKGGMSGMDHSKMEKGGMSGMDHSKMEKGGMAGMDHSKTDKGGMAGMDHSKMEKGGMAMGDPATAAIVSNRSAKPKPGGAASVLSPDPLDAPSATAVEDAGRSEQMNDAMSSGDGMMTMSHGKYVQQDAGRQQAMPGAPSQDMRAGSESKNGSKGAPETYTCPMHSEVTSAVPGKCPKCGMTLVKKGER